MIFLRYLLFFLFLASFLILSFPKDLEAQNLGIGITGGINVTSHVKNFRFASDDIYLDLSPNFTQGYTGGVILRRKLSKRYRFQAEPSIAQFGATYDESFELRGFNFQTDSRTELLYFQLPLLIQISTVTPERTIYGRQPAETTFHFSGGIFGGYLMDARFTGTNTGAPIGIEFAGSFSNDVREQYSDYDGGLIIGGGVEHGNNRKVGLETRFMFAIFDSGNEPQTNFEPQNMALTFSLYYIL